MPMMSTLCITGKLDEMFDLTGPLKVASQNAQCIEVTQKPESCGKLMYDLMHREMYVPEILTYGGQSLCMLIVQGLTFECI